MNDSDIASEKVPPIIEPENFGGWLLLPMIGLFVVPLISGYGIYSEIQQIVNVSSETLFPHAKLIDCGEVFFEFLLLVFGLVVLGMFLKKKKIVPVLMISLLSLRVAFILADALAKGLIFRNPGEAFDFQVFWWMIEGQVIQAAIWIPYFWLSERVKITFVVL